MDSDKIMGNTRAALVGLASNHTVLFGKNLPHAYEITVKCFNILLNDRRRFVHRLAGL